MTYIALPHLSAEDHTEQMYFGLFAMFKVMETGKYLLSGKILCLYAKRLVAKINIYVE